MKRVFVSTLMTLVLLSLVACNAAVSPTGSTVAPEITGVLVGFEDGVLQSEQQRVAYPNVRMPDRESLIDGNSAFAFDLYQALKEEGGNLFYSPFSLSLALAMTYAGARGETEQQMADTLHFTLPQEKLHPAFNWLDSELARRGEGAEGKDEGGFRLNIINAIWGQNDYQFLLDFLDTLAENYGAGLRGLDFINQPEESRITINEWVSQQTEGRIKDLIPQGLIDEMARLVLTNAIYFNAAWKYQFDEDKTEDGSFYLLDGGQFTVPMMNKTGKYFNYAEGDGYQAVELPYDGGELSMVVLLPEAGQFEAFEASLDARLVEDIIRGMASTWLALTMPKFEFESAFSLKETLSALGMPLAFDMVGADFSGTTYPPELFIKDVLHKAFVSVDEKGTEAAAASVVIEIPGAVPEPLAFTIDRPFIFLIRDIPTNTILFIGRVLNPNA